MEMAMLAAACRHWTRLTRQPVECAMQPTSPCRMLHARLLRSPHPHALIRSLDTSAAEQLPGVAAILTASNLRAVSLGVQPSLRADSHQPILASDRVRYVGEPIAAVAAETPELAERALEAIKVDYEVLEPALTIEAAMAEGAPQIHPEGNIDVAQKVVHGDVDKGFAEADAIVENWYYCGYQEHGYLEPEAGLAYVDEDGRLVLEACTQFHHQCQASLARLLGLPKDQVRVIATPSGGGFGGKYVEHPWMLAALLAYEIKRPVS